MRTDKSDPNQQDTFKEDEDDSGSDSDDNDKAQGHFKVMFFYKLFGFACRIITS